ncbi:unnamed protein product [Lampetra fluviatilis]
MRLTSPRGDRAVRETSADPAVNVAAVNSGVDRDNQGAGGGWVATPVEMRAPFWLDEASCASSTQVPDAERTATNGTRDTATVLPRLSPPLSRPLESRAAATLHVAATSPSASEAAKGLVDDTDVAAIVSSQWGAERDLAHPRALSRYSDA